MIVLPSRANWETKSGRGVPVMLENDTVDRERSKVRGDVGSQEVNEAVLGGKKPTVENTMGLNK